RSVGVPSEGRVQPPTSCKVRKTPKRSEGVESHPNASKSATLGWGTRVKRLWCTWHCLPPFAKNAKDGAPTVWVCYRKDGSAPTGEHVGVWTMLPRHFGGWPALARALFFLSHNEAWLPHPCVFCKGGRDAADSIILVMPRGLHR